jgi:hypothetical protein
MTSTPRRVIASPFTLMNGPLASSSDLSIQETLVLLLQSLQSRDVKEEIELRIKEGAMCGARGGRIIIKRCVAALRRTTCSGNECKGLNDGNNNSWLCVAESYHQAATAIINLTFYSLRTSSL